MKWKFVLDAIFFLERYPRDRILKSGVEDVDELLNHATHRYQTTFTYLPTHQ